MSDTGPGREDDDLLAAEYALGLLEGEDRVRADRQALSDPAFARAADAWQARFAALSGSLAEQPAPPGLWTRIASRLDERVSVVELRLRRGLALWRGVAAAAAAVAAALALVLVWPRPVPVAPPVMAAKLVGSQGAPVFVVFFDPARQQMVLAPAQITPVAGRSPELWLIPAGGKPIPLKVATFQEIARFAPHDAVGAPGDELAVSLEPVGGSPTGQPTGPIVATGKLKAL